MKTFNFIVENRKIRYIGEQEVSVVGDANVDTFHFDFDAEWDNLNQKKILFIKNEHWYWANLDSNNSVALPNEIYGSQEFEFGVTGKNTNSQLSTSPYWQTTNISIYLASGDPENLPAKEVWDIYTEEMLALVAQGQITLEECQSILESIQQIQTELEQLQETVESDVSTIQQLKTQIESDISEVNVKIAAFDTNFEEKLAAFNSNYTEKLNTFNSNAETKTTDFNTNAVNKKSDFDSNASNKKTDFNSNASSKKSDFNSNATSKTNSFNSNYDEKLASVNSAGTTQVGNVNTAGATQVGNVNTAGSTAVSNIETAENSAVQNIQNEGGYYAKHIKALEDNFDTDTTPNSNNFVLEDSASGYIPRDDEGNPFDIKIGDGPVLEQETTEGKNKYNINDLTSFHCTFEVSGQSVTVTATQTYAYIEQKIDNLDTTKLYRISFDGDAASWITVLDSSKTKTNEAYGSKALGFTPTTSTIHIRLYATTSGTSATKTWSNIQLEEGSTATSYEKYTGGQPSPNLSYPQDITVVEGECGVEVNNKNFFDKENTVWDRDNGSGYNIWGQGTNTTRIRTSSFPLKGGQTYTISGIPDGISLIGVRTYVQPSGTTTNGATRNGNSFTLVDNVNYIHLLFGGTDFTDETKVLMKNADIQIQLGEVEMTYVSYKHQSYPITLLEGMFLGSIGTASNYIKGTKDNWKLVSSLGKFMLDGSESWRKADDTPVDRFIWNTFKATTGILTVQLSNYFRKVEFGSNVPGGIRSNTTQLIIDFSEYGTTTLEQFQEWLSQHSVEGYGLLETSTETDITDTTLVTQLNNIVDNLQTYKGGTVVFTSGESLAPNIQFDYMVNPLASMQSDISDMKNAILSLGGEV